MPSPSKGAHRARAEGRARSAHRALASSLASLASITSIASAACIAPACRASPVERGARAGDDAATLALPAPRTSGSASLEQAIARRRSIRDFSTEPLSRADLGQILWAAQGVTDVATGHRAAPSAGALYPLELYAVTGEGVFRYRPARHELQRLRAGDVRDDLARAALDQQAVRTAALDLVVDGVVARTRAKYGDRAERYVDLEAGHAAQNALLQATSLGLGGVPIGAFDDAKVRAVVGASSEETPLYVVAIGHAAAP